MNRLYLDFNATSPIDPEVLEVLIQHLEQDLANPSSIHHDGRTAKRLLDQSRQTIAHYFGVRPQEVIFTSGGTEGAALLLRGICEKKSHGEIISSMAEHACVLETLKELEKKGSLLKFLPLSEKGEVGIEALESIITSSTSLITLMAANNETGVLTDIAAVAKIAENHKIPFVVDGVAWLGKQKIHLPKGVSAIFFSGHKIGAPKGIGCCIVKSEVRLNPLFIGGGQEMNRRAGTENLSGIVALAKAISLLDENFEKREKHLNSLRDAFESQLLAQLPNVLINGEAPRVANTVNLAFIGIDGENLLMHLDREGLSASLGSACSSGSIEPSKVLMAMGLPMDRVNSSIRFSFGYSTTLEDIQNAVEKIVAVVSRIKGIPKI